MPDFFHCMHALVKSYSLPIGQRLRQAQQERIKAKEAMTRRHGPPQGAPPDPKAKALGEARQGEVTQWEEAHHPSRDLWETLSLTLHPFRISDSAPQTSAQVESQLQATGEALAA